MILYVSIALLRIRILESFTTKPDMLLRDMVPGAKADSN